MESIESKILSVIPKLKEVQKSTGIRRVTLYLVNEYKYEINKFKKVDSKLKIYLKAPLVNRDMVEQFKILSKSVFDMAGIEYKFFCKYCAAGYPFTWKVKAINLLNNTEFEIKSDEKIMTVLFLLVPRTIEICIEFYKELDKLTNEFPEICKNYKFIMSIAGKTTDFLKKFVTEAKNPNILYCAIDNFRSIENYQNLFKADTRFMIIGKNGIVNAVVKISRGTLKNFLTKGLTMTDLWENHNEELSKNKKNEQIVQNIEEYLQANLGVTNKLMVDFDFKLGTKRKYNLLNDQITDRNPKASLEIKGYNEDKILLTNIIDETRAFISKKILNSTRLSFANPILLQWGDFCTNCKIPLKPGQIQFKCVDCKPPLILCEKCANSKTNPNSAIISHHPHNFYYNNSVPENKISKISHSTIRTNQNILLNYIPECDECKQDITEFGWRCLNCGIAAFCNGCFKAGQYKDEKNSQLHIGGIVHNYATHIYQIFIVKP